MTQRDADDKRRIYSQNFLRPGRTVRAMVAEPAISSDDIVVEVGGGSGVLTRELEATGCRLLVVEKDPRYSGELRDRYADDVRVKVVAGDVRDLEWPSEPFRVFANIPFGVTTDILRVLLEDSGPGLRRADLIMQLDVARKRSAPPRGNKLNLAWAPWWTMRLGRRLPADLFVPRPAVDAGMLAVTRRPQPLLAWQEQPLWHGILDKAFMHGGEPARRALRGVLTATQLQRVASHREMSPATPVSKLTLEDWIAIHSVVRDHVPQDRWPLPDAPSSRPRRPRVH